MKTYWLFFPLLLLSLVSCQTADVTPTVEHATPLPTATTTSRSIVIYLPSVAHLSSTSPKLNLLDGSKVALVTTTGVVLLTEQDGALRETIFRGAYGPIWSPGGRALAFETLETIGWIDTATLQSHQIAIPRHDYENHLLRWSPDGRWLSFWRAKEITPGPTKVQLDLWIAQSDGSTLRQLLLAWQAPYYQGPADVSWSSDGTVIAYTVAEGGWRLIEVASGADILIPSATSSSLQGRLQLPRVVWAPSDAVGVTMLNLGKEYPDCPLSLTLFDAHARRVIRETIGCGIRPLRWSADGSEFLFNAPVDYENRLDRGSTPEPLRTFALPRDGGAIRLLPPAPVPTPTPHSKQTMVANSDGIYAIAPDGSRRALVEFNYYFTVFAAYSSELGVGATWSANRKRIIFAAGDNAPTTKGDHDAVWSLDVATGELDRLIADTRIYGFLPLPK